MLITKKKMLEVWCNFTRFKKEFWKYYVILQDLKKNSGSIYYVILQDLKKNSGSIM